MEQGKEITQINRSRATRQAPVNGGDTIDWLKLLLVLKDNIVGLLMGLLIGALAVGLYTKNFITPQYTTTSSIFVYSRTTLEQLASSISLGNSMAGNYAYLARTHEVAEDVIEKLDLDMSTGGVLSCISVSNPSGTTVLEITATYPDPEMAAKLSNAMADTMRERIASVVNTTKPAVVSTALVPTYPSSPNLKRNVQMGAMAGFALVAGLVVLGFLLDDTIKSTEEVERYLNLQVLAVLPKERGMKVSGEASRRRKMLRNPVMRLWWKVIRR